MLPKLLFKFADQPVKPIFYERINRLFRYPARLFQPPFQFFSVALFGHGVIPVYI